MNSIGYIKLKPSLFDRLFRKYKYKEVIKLRTQISAMLVMFNAIDIWKRISKYSDVSIKIARFDSTTLNEIRMYHELGEKSVIDVLKSDRNEIFGILSIVEELDLSRIVESIREDSIKIIFND